MYPVFLKGGSIAVRQVTKLRAGQSRVRMPEEARRLFLFSKHQTSSGAHPAFYSMCIRGNFPRVGAGGMNAT